MSDQYITHFAAGEHADVTLCGLAVESVIMSDRPATCPACVAAHTPWTFPLPPTVTA